MRCTITHADEAPPSESASAGTIRLKLFNLLIAELGPLVLARGVIVDPETARAVLPPQSAGALPKEPGPFLLRVSFAQPVSPSRPS